MASESLPSPNRCVLVVEDEWLLRWALGQALAGAGFGVIEAGSADEAVARFRERQDDVAVILLDLRLPDSDGMCVLRHVKALRPGCPVIIMTAHGTAENALEALSAGAAHVVMKPFGYEAMLDLVRAEASRAA